MYHIWRDSLIKEGLKDDDFITRFDECHEGTEHTFIGSSGNGNLCVRVDGPCKERRIGIGNGFLQPRSTLCHLISELDLAHGGPDLGRRILIAVHSVQCLFGSIGDVFGRVVTTLPFRNALGISEAGASYSQKPLAHVDDWLNWRSCGCFVHDSPRHNLSCLSGIVA